MATPLERYRQGYQKGRADNLAGNVAQAFMGMLQDDPGGSYAAGYKDGSGRKKFSPPSDAHADEKAELNPFDDKVAIRLPCPDCGAVDWVEWKFLGHLQHDLCGHKWYAGSGMYLLMQLRAGFGAGQRFSKYLNSGIARGEGAFLARALGWCMGMLLGLGIRLEFGLLMTPIQAVVGLCQPRKTTAEIIARSLVIAISVGAAGYVLYFAH